MTDDEAKESLIAMRDMANELSATISVIRERAVNGERKVLEVLVRKSLAVKDHFLEIRIAMFGCNLAGKSTLLGIFQALNNQGVITQGVTDNGRGRSRLSLLRHRHEILSGRTSSIAHEIIGFTPQGGLINYATTNVTTWYASFT
jgi:GTPase